MKTNYNNIREREEAAQTLLAAYRQGDQNAFMSLYDMYAEMLLNYGLCITSDKELVKDCVQDVFIKLISKSQDLQVTKVTSYLLISLRNRLLDEFRRKNYMTETAVEDIRICGRATQGVRLMRVSAGSRIVAVARAEKEEEPEDLSEDGFFPDHDAAGNPASGNLGQETE